MSRRQKAWLAPVRSSSMPAAARSPAPMASTTDDGPVAASPPVNTQSTEVWPVFGSAGEVAPAVELDGGAVQDGGGVELLADGGDDGVGLDHEVGVVAGHRTATAAAVVVAQRHLLAAHAGDLAARVAEDLLRGDERHDVDALEVGGVDLLAPRRHLRPGAAVEDLDRLGAEAQGGAGGVDGRVAAADHGDVLADLAGAVDVVLLEEGEPVVHAGAVLAGDADAHALRGRRRRRTRPRSPRP